MTHFRSRTQRFTLLSIFVVTLGLASSASAEVGLGVMFGEPSGLSAKFTLDRTSAIDLGLAYSLANDKRLHVHADYLYHWRDVFDTDQADVAPYLGIGGRFAIVDDNELDRGDEDGDRVGVRIPVGIDVVWDDVPLNLFAEVAPIMDLAPETELDFNGAVGLRYVFGR